MAGAMPFAALPQGSVSGKAQEPPRTPQARPKVALNARPPAFTIAGNRCRECNRAPDLSRIGAGGLARAHHSGGIDPLLPFRGHAAEGSPRSVPAPPGVYNARYRHLSSIARKASCTADLAALSKMEPSFACRNESRGSRFLTHRRADRQECAPTPGGAQAPPGSAMRACPQASEHGGNTVLRDPSAQSEESVSRATAD